MESSRPARIALAVAVVTWASAFPMIHMALEGYTPVQIALLRYAVAAVILGGYAVAARITLPPWRDMLPIAGLGVLGIALYNVLLSSGQQGVSSGAASLLVASSPVFMVVLAALFSGERPASSAVGGMLVSFLGVALIASARAGGVGLSGHAFLVLGSAAVGAIYSVFLRPYTLRHGAGPVLVVAVWGSVVALLPAVVGIGEAVSRAPAISTAAVVYLGAVPGVVGYGAWTYASARANAAAAGVALYLVPVVTMLLSLWLLGEIPTAISLVGGALVIGGVAAVRRKPRPLPPAPAPAVVDAC
jgi:drug/metabolite transporter (DMT)-like permease